MKQLRVPLRVALYRDADGDWVAHCLEFDLLGDGPTRELALGRLSDAVAIQVEATVAHGNPDNLFAPADGRFFRMFAAGDDVSAGTVRVEADALVADAQVREYVEPDPSLATA